MNESERETYNRLMDIPSATRERIASVGRQAAFRALEQSFRDEDAARAERQRLHEPVREAMRAAASKSPELARVNEAAKTLRDGHRRQQPPVPEPHLAPKSPLLRHGSIHLVDVAPFDHLTWSSQSGGGGTPALDVNGSTGGMHFGTGIGTPSHEKGTSRGWVALGRLVAPPPGIELLRFFASPAISWAFDWTSIGWREAAGNLWIGQVVNKFDLSGALIGTPVVTKNYLVSFDETDFYSSDSNSGSTSGYNLMSFASVTQPALYECWVWIGGFAEANDAEWFGHSWDGVSLSAKVGALIIDLF